MIIQTEKRKKRVALLKRYVFYTKKCCIGSDDIHTHLYIYKSLYINGCKSIHIYLKV